MLKNRFNTDKVEWSPGCLSWQFVDDKKVSIKMEEIQTKSRSNAHFHTKSRQFFFVLKGKASVDLEGALYDLKRHEGIEIPMGQKHQVMNSGEEELLFLLISFPPIQEDDIRV
jgi:mannose-6-phosphate isomerase-like protein (cupin superfamily)